MISLDSKERVIARTDHGGKVVLIEDDLGNPALIPERRLMIFDARDRCIATIRHGHFSALCNALPRLAPAFDPRGDDYVLVGWMTPKGVNSIHSPSDHDTDDERTYCSDGKCVPVYYRRSDDLKEL